MVTERGPGSRSFIMGGEVAERLEASRTVWGAADSQEGWGSAFSRSTPLRSGGAGRSRPCTWPAA